MAELFDPYLIKTLKKDKHLLEKAEIPIVTASATFKEDLKKLHGFPEDNTVADIVFSRAHYSMATAVAVKIWGKKLQPEKAWIVDPTNYVSRQDWNSIVFTQALGKTLARHSLLKRFKDLFDTFGRSKLPILKSITPPLVHLTEHIKCPILSLHIAAGNILAGKGKQVVQVITDPHVRKEYVVFADRKNIKFCVFDEKTKIEFLEKAKVMNINADPDRVIVTGPPVDPRVVKARERKHAWRSGSLHLCIATGGLGTNKSEIEEILEQLLSLLKNPSCKCKILLYAGTHPDIYHMIYEIAQRNQVLISELTDQNAKLRVIYHPQIVDANEALITYAFPWADGFITKPSGDMAYDAVASGSFLLTLSEWGVWEERIREVFEQKNISRRALTKNIVDQIEVLSSAEGRSQSWIEKAMHNALTIDPLFLHGTREIIKVIENF